MKNYVMQSVGVFVLLASCACSGQSSPTSPMASSTPTPIELKFVATVPGPGMEQQDVNVLVNGQLNATVSWTDTTKDLDLYWANTACQVDPTSGALIGAGCVVVNQSLSRSGTTEQVSGPVQANTTIRLFVFNPARGPEPTSLHVKVQP